MRSHAHLLAAAPLAGVCYWFCGSWAQALAAGLASVLVDLDHLIDYVWWRGGWRGLGDFFHSFHAHRVTRLSLLGHSWELLALALALTGLMGWPPWPLALCLGWAYHLLCDQLVNPVGWSFYFLLRRARAGFDRRRLPVAGGLDRRHPHLLV